MTPHTHMKALRHCCALPESKSSHLVTFVAPLYILVKNLPLSHSLFFFVYVFIEFIFLEKFQVHRKIKQKVRIVPIYPLPPPTQA